MPKVLVIHGLSAKPAPWKLKGHINFCLDCIHPDDLHILYWADLAGYKPRDWNNPTHHRKSGWFSHVVRKLRGITRQVVRASVEHSIAVALGLDPVAACGAKCLVPAGVFANPLERNARTLFGQQLAEMANYFHEGSLLRDDIIERAHRTLLSSMNFDVVIGHSMGSIILIDLLQAGVINPVKHIVTIGSPLGLGVVRHALKKYYPARRHLSAMYSGEWLNVADPLDIVSLDATLDSEFEGCKVNDVWIENDALDPNGKSHPHSLYGYLRSLPVQQLLRRSL